MGGEEDAATRSRSAAVVGSMLVADSVDAAGSMVVVDPVDGSKVVASTAGATTGSFGMTAAGSSGVDVVQLEVAVLPTECWLAPPSAHCSGCGSTGSLPEGLTTLGVLGGTVVVMMAGTAAATIQIVPQERQPWCCLHRAPCVDDETGAGEHVLCIVTEWDQHDYFDRLAQPVPYRNHDGTGHFVCRRLLPPPTDHRRMPHYFTTTAWHLPRPASTVAA